MYPVKQAVVDKFIVLSGIRINIKITTKIIINGAFAFEFIHHSARSGIRATGGSFWVRHLSVEQRVDDFVEHLMTDVSLAAKQTTYFVRFEVQSFQ